MPSAPESVPVTNRDGRRGELEYPLGSGGHVHVHHAAEGEVVPFEESRACMWKPISLR